MIARQTSLPFADRPKKRRKPGRKPSTGRSRVVHMRRPAHCQRHPLHVTVRLRQGLPSLRSQAMFERVLAKIRDARARFLRIVQWSMQSNHIHLLIEANDRGRLTQGMKGFAVRVAKGLNSLLGIRGRIWADRYHARALKTPREVRNALVYVLCNRAKHGGPSGPDALSSGSFFQGWAEDVQHPNALGSPDDWPVSPPESWLLRIGWKRHGFLGAQDRPS